jgi:hypothetical protein
MPGLSAADIQTKQGLAPDIPLANDNKIPVTFRITA